MFKRKNAKVVEANKDFALTNLSIKLMDYMGAHMELKSTVDDLVRGMSQLVESANKANNELAKRIHRAEAKLSDVERLVIGEGLEGSKCAEADTEKEH